MQHLKNIINGLPYDFKNITIVGDTTQNAIDFFQTVQPESIVLASPFPEDIISGYESKIEINVMPIPWEDDREISYFLSNIRGYSSLLEPKKIIDIFPGLQFSEKKVATQSVEKFNETISIDKKKSNLLFLNTNGDEFEVVNKLGDLVEQFNCIIIRVTTMVLYGKKEPAFSLLSEYLLSKNIPYSLYHENTPPFQYIVINRPPQWICTRQEEIKQNDQLLNDNNLLVGKLKQALSDLESSVSQCEISKSELVKIEVELAASNLQKSQEYQLHQEYKKKYEKLVEEYESLKKQLQQKEIELIKVNENNRVTKSEIMEVKEALDSSNLGRNREYNWHQEFKKKYETIVVEYESLNQQLQQKEKAILKVDEEKKFVESQRQELDYRQQKLDSEIAKVEAQLELVKDVILREKAF